MKIPLPIVKKFSILKLFVWVIAVPCILVLITICDMKRESRLHKVTHEVFFDIEIDGKPEGRMVLGLFGEAVPMTVRNFYTFATTGYRGKMYENTNIHRVIKKFMIQGGDVVNGDGTGHLSIYGDTFPDENFEIHHSSAGFLSMANSGKDTNGCQFFITTLAVNYLDGKHVAFGKVVHGQGLVHKIEYLGTDWNDRPLKEVKIVKSGSQPLSSPYWISDDPYNLRDWLKTISFPLGLSFTIVFIFNYFIKKLDVCIDAADEVEKKEKVLRKIVKMKEEEKASMKGEEDKEIKEAPKVRKRNPKAMNEK